MRLLIIASFDLMLILLPFIVLLLLTLIRRHREPDWRSAVLSAAVVWGLIVTIMTEALSSVHLLTATWVAGAWTVTSFALAVYSRMSWRQIVDLRHIKTPKVSLQIGFMLTGLGFIVSATGLIALVAPPNTWDSMSYHMARVMQWIQHQTLAHYPTHMPNQLHRNPWAEYVILHLQLLSHGDHFANLVQWLSMLGSLTGVSLIAKHLGADKHGQLLAVVMAGTTPMGILQASSTQTDYVGAFWLVCFVRFCLPLVACHWSPYPWEQTVFTGLSLGLAILTKATGYLYAFPFILWLGVAALLRGHGKKSLLAIMVMVSITVGINLGHYERNLDLYGSPIGPIGEELCPECKITNDAWTLPLFLSNLARNVGIHLGTPFESLNHQLMRTMYAFHAVIGIEVNDPRSTWLQRPFIPLVRLFDENLDGNTLHLLLICHTIVCLITLNRIRILPFLYPYALSLIAGFLVLSLVLKWNPYNSRLHLPLFILWSPLIGIILSRLQWPRFTGAVVFVAIISSLPWILFNDYRPLVNPPFRCQMLPDGESQCTTEIPEELRHKPNIFSADRYRLYFINDPALADGYATAVRLILEHNCVQVGLVKDWDAWEYPLWVLMMREAGKQPIRIDHVSVANSSALLSLREPYRSFRPCAILSIVGRRLKVHLVTSAPEPGSH